MPFVEMYAVSFGHRNLNLSPHLNLRGWPDMRQRPAATTDGIGRCPDSGGLSLLLSRRNSQDPTRNSVELFLPQEALPFQTRFSMKVTFDCASYRPLPFPVGTAPVEPAPWAVALFVSGKGFSRRKSAIVTCQFNAYMGGVRINTPNALQRDLQAVMAPLPTDSDARLYTLEHSFGGWRSPEPRYTPGSGSLWISGGLQHHDHRVYSSNALFGPAISPSRGVTAGLTAVRSFRTLGVSLATDNALGHMSVRLRSFSLSLGTALSDSPQSSSEVLPTP